MNKGLPHMDVPLHLQDPYSCKRCSSSYYSADDTQFRYLRCGRAPHAQQCRYERHETGSCGPAAIYWTERTA